MYTFDTKENGQTAILDVQGSLTKSDYDQIRKELEPLFKEHNKLDLVVDVSGLSGATPGAATQDLIFTLKHYNDFRRVAVVGDSTWQKWLTKLGEVLPNVETQYFDESSRDKAESWVTTSSATPSS